MFTSIFTFTHTFDIGLTNDEVYDVKAIGNDKLCFIHLNGIRCWHERRGIVDRPVRGFSFRANGTSRILWGKPEGGYELHFEEIGETLYFADAESLAYEPFSKFGYVDWGERNYVVHQIYGKKRFKKFSRIEDFVIGRDFIAVRRCDEWLVKSFDLKRVASMHFLEQDDHDLEFGELGYAVMFSEKAMNVQRALILKLTNTGLLGIGQIKLTDFSAKRTIKDRSLFVTGKYVVYHVGKPKPTIWAIAEIEPRGVWA